MPNVCQVESIRTHACKAMQRLGDLFAADETEPPPLADGTKRKSPVPCLPSCSLTMVSRMLVHTFAGTLAADMDVALAAADVSDTLVASKSKSAAAAASSAAVAAAAAGRAAPPALEGTLFATPPHPSAAALVASEIKPLITPVPHVTRAVHAALAADATCRSVWSVCLLTLLNPDPAGAARSCRLDCQSKAARRVHAPRRVVVSRAGFHRRALATTACHSPLATPRMPIISTGTLDQQRPSTSTNCCCR